MTAPGTRVGMKAVLAAIALLVVGGVLGVTLDRHLTASRPHAPAAVHDAALAELGRRLDLNTMQRRQVDSILRTHREALHETWAALHARLGATVDSVHREVEAVLTPEQRAEFRAWVREVSGAGRH